MPRKIVLFELNEVPFRIFDEYCRWRPNSTFARVLPRCAQHRTIPEEAGPLSPWITWPSVHRGVHDERHGILDFGQDLTEVDRRYPPIWQLLTRAGVRVGLCGTLHSYPPPADLRNYAFYLPDTFAAGPECFPRALEVFQAFNLRMARESGRNVDRRVAWREGLALLARAPGLGLRPATLAEAGGQLLAERVQAWRTVRRRTYQAMFSFDIFMRQLETTLPAFSSYFTNHVASSLHRYWAAVFPGEYAKMGYDPAWRRMYRGEIAWTMDKSDEFMARLVRFADRRPEYQIWVATSMGQAATVAEEVQTQLFLTDADRFMRALGFTPDQWSRRPAMLPQYSFVLAPDHAERFNDALSRLVIADRPIGFRQREAGFFSVDLGHENLQSEPPFAWSGERRIAFTELGLECVEIQDRTCMNAYHVPEGCLLIYDPVKAVARPDRPEISTLDIAPAILHDLGVAVPSYMHRPAALAPR